MCPTRFPKVADVEGPGGAIGGGSIVRARKYSVAPGNSPKCSRCSDWRRRSPEKGFVRPTHLQNARAETAQRGVLQCAHRGMSTRGSARSLRQDASVLEQIIKPGTTGRILRSASWRSYRSLLS